MDRTLIPLCFLLVTGCASGGSSEPCAPAPQPANPHAGDLVDTTEKEAVSSKPTSPSSDPAPVASTPPAAAPSDPAECVIPKQSCGDPAACKSLEEICHSIGDPIAKNDSSAFSQIASDEAKKGVEDKGSPRGYFGFAAQGPLSVTLARDCRQCRRSFISYDIKVADVTIRAMVEGGKITSWSKPK